MPSQIWLNSKVIDISWNCKFRGRTCSEHTLSVQQNPQIPECLPCLFCVLWGHLYLRWTSWSHCETKSELTLVGFFIQFGDLGTLKSLHALTVAFLWVCSALLLTFTVFFWGGEGEAEVRQSIYSYTSLGYFFGWVTEDKFSLKLWLFSSSLV